MNEGLTELEAAKKLKEQGYNELYSARPKTVLHIALEVMKEPMFLLLISCSVLYMLLGDYQEGLILLSAILVIIFITFYQYQKTEKALEALKKLSSPRVLVIRDGKETRIPGREVVPDDLMVLNEGDRVGADGIVLESQHLNVDESLLTGESVAVVKNCYHDHADHTGKVFSGTLVTQGKATVRVTETGMQTEIGKIGASLSSIQQEPTRLQKEMKSLIRVLFIIGLGLTIIVVLAFYFANGNFLQALLNGLAAAMAILPEEFPVVLTVFLALGAWRLSRNHVLTRKPSAIETLGSATVLCTDKTGTITQNVMQVVEIYNGNEFVPHAAFASNREQVIPLLSAAGLACNEHSVDPMEKAIVEAYRHVSAGSDSFHPLIRAYPLSRALLAMTMVRSINHQQYASAKGAPEAIFALCRLSEEEKKKNITLVNRLAEKGYRVLGVATAHVPAVGLPADQQGFEFTFQGFLALEDPIRPEVPAAVEDCRKAGIKVVMITGDFPATAKSIGRQIGLPEEGELLTGEEVKKMSDGQLASRIAGVHVFARVVPDQKLRIVKALQKNGEVVAMTGDGVNDAPALKAADIGIAMGRKGTDVAREASSLVLLDDDFASIVSSIRSGRRIFDNLQKAMSYIMAVHVPIVGLTLMPAFFGSLPLLLMPLHIVFMELLIDPSCSIAFEYEQEERNVMTRKPRNPEHKFFGMRRIIRSILRGVLLLAMVVIVYFLSAREGHTEGEARAITFSALIIGNLALILTSLSRTRSFFSVFTERNYSVMIIMTIALGVLVAVITVPSLQKTFSFEFPGYAHFISSMTGAVVLLLILESVKFVSYKRHLRHQRG